MKEITMQQIREAMSRYVYDNAWRVDKKLFDIYPKPECQAKTMTYEDFMKALKESSEAHP